MLKDVVQKQDEFSLAMSDGKANERLEQGIYKCYHFNFECDFRNQQYELDYPVFHGEAFHCYGVCDSVEQLKAALPKEVTEGPLGYVIAVHELNKKDMSPEGGWRWRKWGTVHRYTGPAVRVLVR